MRINLKMAPPTRTIPQNKAETGLDQLGPGRRAVVRVVGGEQTVRQRLLELGFVAGTALRVVRLAPLGDPMQVELHGSHISLRRSEARTILVEPA